MERRIAAILAADMVGYSRLMEADEVGTLGRQKRHQSELIGPKIEKHGGQTLKLTGDGLIAEFPSVVEAVQCAVSIQAEMSAREAEERKDRKIQYRIAINLGDVIFEDGDVFGDGVNIAARLESLADPGGVIVSGTAYDHLKSNVSVGYEDLGELQVKNIARPIRAWRVLLDPKLAGHIVVPRNDRKTPRILAVAATVVGLLAVGGWWWTQGPDFTPADPVAMAFPLPDKPSIAVLPFADLTQEEAMLVDGLTDDLITDLSKLSGLFVIAGNTSFAYRQAEISIAEFAEALGVRYVVDGSVRRSGDGVRINGRLIDATTGQIAWAQRFDTAAGDLFTVQTQLVREIAATLALTVSDSEMAQIAEPDTQLLEAREAFQRGWELYGRFNERDNAAAIPFFERAIALDPEYGRAYGALALAHLRPHVFHHWNAGVGDGEKLHLEAFSHYMNLASQHETSLIHVIRAIVHMNLGDWFRSNEPGLVHERAEAEARRAIALRPNDPEAHIVMAWSLIAGGQPDDGLNFVDSAMRLDPAYPSHYVLFQAAAFIAKEQLPDAESALKAGLERDPDAVELLPVLASVLAQQGKQSEARDIIERWEAREDPAALKTFVEEYFFIVRWAGEDRRFNAQIRDGLRRAALSRGVTIASLRADLSDSNPVQKLEAVRSLALFGSAAAQAVPDLIELLDAESSVLRRSTVVTLGRIGPSAAAAIPALEAIDPNSLIGRHARRALDKIQPSQD